MPLHVPLLDSNRLMAHLDQLKSSHRRPPWIERVVLTEGFHITVICQNPGAPTDRHRHEFEEAWYIVEGEIDWFFEGSADPLHSRAGDFVFAPRERYHQLQVVGAETSLRIAMGTPNDVHIGERH